MNGVWCLATEHFTVRSCLTREKSEQGGYYITSGSSVTLRFLWGHQQRRQWPNYLCAPWQYLHLVVMITINSTHQRLELNYCQIYLAAWHQRRTVISRQSIRRNQILRNFISRKNRTLKLLRVSEKSDFQLQEMVMGNNPGLT
jgi:hypothetical protein